MIAVLGRELHYPTENEPLHSWLLENWHFPESARACVSSWCVRLGSDAGEFPREVAAASVDTGSPTGTKHLALGDDSFWILDAECGVRGELAGDSASIELYGQPFEGWAALHAAIGESLMASGLIRLHASAMSKDGRTCLLVGPSGAGKSTTVLRGIAAGWRPIADDGCWLEPSTLRIFGADRHLRLRPEDLDLARAVRSDIGATGQARGKYEISYAEFGGRVDDRIATDLVLLKLEPDSPSAWLPMAQSQAVMALYQATGLPLTHRLREALAQTLGELARRLECSTLRLGSSTLPL